MGDADIPNWLKGLPLAPEFRPTDTEFADPIAYISKIEKEASAFGICKVIPPLPKPSKKYVLTNLNKSLAKCPELGPDVNSSKVGSGVGCNGGGNDGESRAVFTTRHQELGQSGKGLKGPGSGPQVGVHKQVWQSGEVYTLEQFENKSKAFAKSLLGGTKEVSPLVVEAMFWKLSSEKPIYIEYANDVPGSGFGEPESPVKYFHRRRKRVHYQRSRESSDCRVSNMDSVLNSHENDKKDTPISKDQDALLGAETPKSSIAPSSLSNNEATSSSRRKRLNSRNEMEGTAGWKLSNSPWNLQVIARSPGSLTRFMPDDIPGVTSPMVYIGMLFSWFAWHVEDHELHSMNFLHTGSAKTWYAVPGDYAYAFEEVIRTEAYGGNIDHLAALGLLGEKTTLLSPEVVVASGLPCCRLIQNPGEYVVTFPRAYHIGFSHGFNCGEAANFGTPQWLKVAKEAAVRRAAMNYLPMLSHRQLLYLLTMSFVSRVPRSLLPGARSSRLRDRQKEERELLVKKAFIEDMLKENNLLNVLLSKKSTYQAVLWDPDLLPSSNQGSLLSTGNVTVTAPVENAWHGHSEDHCNQNITFDESLYMGTLNNLYLDDYDLSCDFQVDSGTLPCVACGILGFPFMSVVQPSNLPSDQILVQGSGMLKSPSVHSSSDFDCGAKGTVSEGPTVSSVTRFRKGWNTASGFVRPRIFCLEHAVQIEELLRSKGGANVLVICHTDYQKMKAHAAAMTKEIDHPFNYIEIPFDKASCEDLNLIDLAIDDEEHVECGEDWTAKLDVNLRHCIRVRKNSPSRQVQHALALGGLFTEKCSSSEFFNIKWQSQRSRSRLKLNLPVYKPCRGIQKKKVEVLGGISDVINIKKGPEILIQYRRRKLKSKQGDLAVTNRGPQSLLLEVSATTSQDIHKYDGKSSENLSFDEEIKTISSGLCCSASVGTPQLQDETTLKATLDIRLTSDPARMLVPLPPATLVVENVEEQGENPVLDRDGCEMQNKSKVSEKTSENNEVSCATKYGGSLVSGSLTDGEFEKQEESEISEPINIAKEACHVVAHNHPEGQHKSEADGDVMNEVSDVTNPANSDAIKFDIGGFHGDIVNTVVANSCTQSEVSFSGEGQQEREASNVKEPISSNAVLMIQLTHDSVEKISEVRTEASATCEGESSENVAQQEMKTANRSNDEAVSNHDRATHGGGPDEILCGDVALDDEEQETFQITDKDTPSSVEECSELRRESCAAEGSSSHDNREHESTPSPVIEVKSTAAKGRKRRREMDQNTEGKCGFIRGPCEGLRPRARRDGNKMERPVTDASVSGKGKQEKAKGGHRCEVEGCRMSFRTKAELQLHKSNRCPHEGCRRKFSSHKYAVLHQRVHEDDRPLKCSWEGCSMSFKWAWARTEHMRLHTDERPYQCKVEGCGLSFKFVSDYSRHRRKMGHYVA